MQFLTLAGCFDGLRPPPRLTPTEWADTHRVLSSQASAEPGLWRTAKTPYLQEPMDCFDAYSPIREVIFMKGAQIGITEMLYNVMGYVIDVNPGPILSIMPTSGTSEQNTKMRFTPMVEASPTLLAKVGIGKSRTSSNTITQKSFPGGVIVFGGANSAASLRSLPIKFLLMDELDAYPNDLDNEGSPVELAKTRTSTFGSSKKIAYVSTPTDEDTSLIAEYFKASDMRYYHVPCPHCGLMQQLVWSRMVYDKDLKDIQDVKYQCVGCEELIEERFKSKMLAQGVWTVTNPSGASKTKRGYHLSSLYSPLGWKSWADIANQVEVAERENDDAKRKVVVNTVFGETTKNKSITPKPQRLYDRAGGYARGEIPDGAAILTAGVDVQKNRLEVEIVGWGFMGRSWSIDYHELPGDTTQPKVWDDLTNLLYRTWTRPDGREMGLSKMAVDSGYNTVEVYAWCRRHSSALVMAVKGQDNSKQSTLLRASQPVDLSGSGKKIAGVGLWTLGVDLIKSEVYAKMNLDLDGKGEAPSGYCYFPDGYPLEYYNMLCAERREARKDTKGYMRWTWKKHRPRNEAFDCRVYARAAVHLVGVDRWSEKDWESELNIGYTPPQPTNMKLVYLSAPEAEEQKPPPRARKKRRGESEHWS
jgi:phage terminase large subunit GpA-like protein